MEAAASRLVVSAVVVSLTSACIRPTGSTSDDTGIADTAKKAAMRPAAYKVVNCTAANRGMATGTAPGG